MKIIMNLNRNLKTLNKILKKKVIKKIKKLRIIKIIKIIFKSFLRRARYYFFYK